MADSLLHSATPDRGQVARSGIHRLAESDSLSGVLLRLQWISIHALLFSLIDLKNTSKVVEMDSVPGKHIRNISKCKRSLHYHLTDCPLLIAYAASRPRSSTRGPLDASDELVHRLPPLYPFSYTIQSSRSPRNTHLACQTQINACCRHRLFWGILL